MKSESENKTKFKNIFKRGDVLLILILIIAIIVTAVFASKTNANQVEIYVDGKLKYQMDLNINTEISLLDHDMVIRILDRKVYVEASNCLEQLCVNASPLSTSGGIIVCLPNKVVLKVATKKVAAIT